MSQSLISKEMLDEIGQEPQFITDNKEEFLSYMINE
jgi:hypothetical protein